MNDYIINTTQNKWQTGKKNVFHFYSLNKDISLTIQVKVIKSYSCAENSQIEETCLSFKNSISQVTMIVYDLLQHDFCQYIVKKLSFQLVSLYHNKLHFRKQGSILILWNHS